MNKNKKKYNTSLAVMRAQPFHFGHKRLIDSMLSLSDSVVVVLGSIQESGTKQNPFSYEFRKKCIELSYEKEIASLSLKIMGLEDVDSSIDWGYYVLDAVKEEFNLIPDAYFYGDEGNGRYFENSGLVLECKNRDVGNLISGTKIREIIESESTDCLEDYIPYSTKEMLKRRNKKC